MKLWTQELRVVEIRYLLLEHESRGPLVKGRGDERGKEIGTLDTAVIDDFI